MARPRVLLCSLDGVRPDALQAARTPVIDRLAGEGACSWGARAVMPSATLPCHTSMLRGVDVPRHGITTNAFQPLVRPVPSLIEAAKEGGLRTGAFYNWEQLRDLAAPGKLDVSVMVGDCHSAGGDLRVARAAAHYVRRVDFDLVFLYLGWPDECGHLHGWMSEPYLEAVAHADTCLGEVAAALEADGRPDGTVTLVVSDHGGHGRTHGTDCPEDMTIPWILHGPGVRQGHEIQASPRIFDTCPTLARLLGLPHCREWDGRVIEEALA